MKSFRQKTISPNRNRTMVLIKTFIVAVPLVAVITLLIIILHPFGYSKTFTVDVGNSQDTSSDRFYMRNLSDEGRIGDPVNAGGVSYREITGTPIYFDLDSPINIGRASRLHVEARLSRDHNIKIGTTDFKNYSWQDVYKNFFKDYTNIHEFDDGITAFSKEEVAAPKKDQSLNDWIKESFKPGSIISTERDIISEADFAASPPTGTDTSKNAVIFTPLRIKNLLLYTHFSSGEQTLKITKKDLNWSSESDELTVVIKNLKDETILEDQIVDDGVKTNSNQSGPDQTKDFSFNIEDKGVYKIILTAQEDTTTKWIEVSSPYLVVKGQTDLIGPSSFFPAEFRGGPFQVFFKNRQKQLIRLTTVHKEGLQQIDLTDNGARNNISLEETSKQYDFTFSPATQFNQLFSPAGDIILGTEGFYSFSENAFFDPLSYIITGQQSPDVSLYLAKDPPAIPQADGEWITVSCDLNPEDLIVSDQKIFFAIDFEKVSLDSPAKLDYFKVTIDSPSIFNQ